MKKFFFILFLLCICVAGFADHLKGGWIYYEYLGQGSAPNTSRYKITVKQYMRCGDLDVGQLDEEVFVGIFDPSSNQLLETISIPFADSTFEEKSDFSCITNPPRVCYRVDAYTSVIDFPDNIAGYILSVQRCCRITGIINISNSGTVGLTYTNTIPGVISGQPYRNNSSPVFAQNDTVILCLNSPFTFNFNATDADGDSLQYSFVEGLTGGNSSPTGIRPNPPILPRPPYFPGAVIPYSSGFSGASPLGADVSIDPVTGIISGKAPSIIGTYVIAVVANEFRNGVKIGSTRKEIHIDVADCGVTAVQLNPTYYVCDSYSYTFKNEVAASEGSAYLWNFADPSTGAGNTSASPTPTHVFSDTGLYKIKLKITSSQGCRDSTTASVNVYPGFSRGFTVSGQCENTPIQFNDTTRESFGIINATLWNFGDTGTLADTSIEKNPAYTYRSAGNYEVTFLISNSKGCSDTIVKTIVIKDKPVITVSNDTLICSIDTLRLNVTGNGTVLWTPNYNINDQNKLSPQVSPDVPTTYYVTVTDIFGCQGSDSAFVDVKRSVTLDAGADTNICQGDTMRFNTVSDALYYNWSPAPLLNSGSIKNPLTSPQATTTFYVIGNIGKCQAEDSVKVNVYPYPLSAPKLDTSICIGQVIQFNLGGGSNYSWAPASFLNNAHIPDPVASPSRSVTYIVAISDTLGCAGSVYDTISIQVQQFAADAGPRDTTIAANQPLQLNATGGQSYLWTPAAGLNNTAIANPVAVVRDDIDYVVTVSTSAGCTAKDTISVKVFKVPSGLYVPNAFTPNGDGLNDFLRPVSIGMKQITYFKVYNRWGIMVYSGNKPYYKQGEGWDGTYKTKAQNSAVYVWIAQGINYLDKEVTQKGMVTLIR